MAVSVAAFRDERRLVCRPLGLVAFEPGGRRGGVEAGRRRGYACGVGCFYLSPDLMIEDTRP